MLMFYSPIRADVYDGYLFLHSFRGLCCRENMFDGRICKRGVQIIFTPCDD